MRLTKSDHPGAAGALRVSTDAYIAALAAHSGSPGAVIIVGTGSVGYRIEAAGHCRLVGGWGFPIGDEGSGAWIGRQHAGPARVRVHPAPCSLILRNGEQNSLLPVP